MNVFQILFKFLLHDLRYFNALALRIVVIVLTELNEYSFEYAYTDSEYHVISEGAKHIMKLESPYSRETYRCSPLLGFLMIPNNYLLYFLGKVIYSFIDIVVGLLIEVLLNLQNKKKLNEDPRERVTQEKKENTDNNYAYTMTNIVETIYQFVDNPYTSASLVYLYNPLTIYMCTRGSYDCIGTFLILLTLILIELGLFPLGAIIYGVAVHFKFYILIYAPALCFYIIGRNDNKKQSGVVKPVRGVVEATEKKSKAMTMTVIKFFYNMSYLIATKFAGMIFTCIRYTFHYKSIIFSLLAMISFSSIFVFCYIIFGNQFLYQYLLFPFFGLAHKDSFSMYSYLVYLTSDSYMSKLLTIIQLAPQVFLMLVSWLLLFREINLCLIVQTMIFVTFSKIITVHSFFWCISLVPLIAPFNHLFHSNCVRGIFLSLIWISFTMLWGFYSHILEVKGENQFLSMWIVDVIFFLINSYCIKEVIVLTK